MPLCSSPLARISPLVRLPPRCFPRQSMQGPARPPYPGPIPSRIPGQAIPLDDMPYPVLTHWFTQQHGCSTLWHCRSIAVVAAGMATSLLIFLSSSPCLFHQMNLVNFVMPFSNRMIDNPHSNILPR